MSRRSATQATISATPPLVCEGESFLLPASVTSLSKRTAATGSVEAKGARPLAIEGFFQSVAQGLGETYLSALMVWLGAGGVILGLAGTMPTAATAFSQVAAARFAAGARGARAFIARTWVLQGAALAALGCFALLPSTVAVPLICAGAVTAWFLAGLSVPAIVKALTMHWWGRVADRVGPGPLLRSMGWYILPVSAMWLVSGSVWWIAVAQVYAGLAWGALELAQASALLQTTRGREDAVALFNVVDGGVIILGSLVGGLIVTGADHLIGVGFLAAIAASTVLRALASILLLRRVRTIGIPRFSHRAIPMRLWGVRAARGATFRPWGELPPVKTSPHGVTKKEP